MCNLAKLWVKMALKITIIPYMGIRFVAKHFLANRAEIFDGDSGDYYLSIIDEDS